VYYSVDFIDSRFVAVAGGLLLFTVVHTPIRWLNKTVQNLCYYMSDHALVRTNFKNFVYWSYAKNIYVVLTVSMLC